LGGLGLKAAEWLVTQGARHLVLVGRSGINGDAGETVRKLEGAGAQVVVAQADVSQQDQIAKVIAEMDDTMPPLRGVIHAAGVLDDGLLVQQNWQRFAHVMAPKVDGAWNLHLLCKNRALDFFVLFSSTAPLLGAAGQGNYTAANAFLDALAHLQREQGLPGLSINWGPWSEVGMVAAAQNRDRRRLSDQGMDFIAPAQGVLVLAKLLHQAPPQMVVLSIDWARFFQFFPAARELPLIAHFTHEVESRVGPRTRHSLTQDALLAVMPQERKKLLEIYLCDQIAKVLDLRADSIDKLQPLNNMGVDSLMALELRNRIETDLKVAVPMTEFLQGRTVTKLTGLLLDKLTEPASTQSTPPQIYAASPDGDEAGQNMCEKDSQTVLARLNQLSDEEVDLLLRNELRSP
jgi:NAD(P)-dependent dehydrogenase (short-subunit alcohol dehydrogenase family)/acyl carrier protein